MMNIIRIATVTTVSFIAIPALAATQEELHEALVGNPFQGGMASGAYSSYFAEDGTYHDASPSSGVYEITDEGVCYPGTDFGCYQASIDGTSLEWMEDGESAGTGNLLEGVALDLMAK